MKWFIAAFVSILGIAASVAVSAILAKAIRLLVNSVPDEKVAYLLITLFIAWSLHLIFWAIPDQARRMSRGSVFMRGAASLAFGVMAMAITLSGRFEFSIAGDSSSLEFFVLLIGVLCGFISLRWFIALFQSSINDAGRNERTIRGIFDRMGWRHSKSVRIVSDGKASVYNPKEFRGLRDSANTGKPRLATSRARIVFSLAVAIIVGMLLIKPDLARRTQSVAISLLDSAKRKLDLIDSKSPEKAKANTKVVKEKTISSLGAELIAARASGCGVKPKLLPPMTIDLRLEEAGKDVAKGLSWSEALKASNYRINGSFSVAMKGHANSKAVLREIVTQHCDQLMQPRFTRLGIYSIGKNYWIIFASPFDPPNQADAPRVSALILKLVNEARSESRTCGSQLLPAVSPLSSNDLLDVAAKQHSAAMAAHSFFDHEGQDGSTSAERIRRTGYHAGTSGENIAAGQLTPEEAVSGWLKSPGHCANIMRASFTEMGIGFTANTESKAGIYWVQVFGTPS